MEGGPHITHFAESEAIPQPPDLLEAYADIGVTMYGLTGTFKDLAKMCPVDLHDPRITLEMTNDFVVKTANKARLEIQPEHEEVFTETIERLGLERKFTVAEPAKDPSIAEAEKQALMARREAVVTKLAQKPEALQPREAQQIMHPKPDVVPVEVQVAQHQAAHEITATAARKTALASESQPVIKLKSAPIRLPSVRRVAAGAETQAPSLLDRVIDTAHAAVPNKITPPAITERVASKPEEHAQKDLPTHVLPEVVQELFAGFRDLVQHDAEPALQPLESQSTTRETMSAPSGWTTELSKEPGDLYEDFIEALVAFARAPSLESADATVEHSESGAETSPPIISVVAERLAALEKEEKAQVAPILQEIVGVIHGIELSEAADAAPEVVAAMKLRLEELCVVLFETAGIEYSAEDLTQFIQVMLHQDFRPPVRVLESAGLEHIGTHEAKNQLSQLAGSLVDGIGQEIRQLLGMVVLQTSKPATYDLMA